MCVLYILSFTGLPESDALIQVYVYDPCGGCFTDDGNCKPCKVVLEAESYFSAAVKRTGLEDVCRITVNNTRYEEKKEELHKALFQANVDEKEVGYPVVLAGGKILMGWQQIERELDQALFTEIGREPIEGNMLSDEIEFSVTEESVIVYFGMEDCAACNQAKTFIGTCKQESNNFIVTEYDINSAESWSLFEQYCRFYRLDSDAISVPVIFIGNASLEGYEEIEMFLKYYLDWGYAESTYIGM